MQQETLSALVQKFAACDVLHPSSDQQPLHLYAPGPSEPPTTVLKDLIKATNTLTTSLNTYLSLPINDPKLLSTLRQYTTQSHALSVSTHDTRQRIEKLGARIGVDYGEDIPLDSQAIPGWVITRIEQWGRAAGMDVFKEEQQRRITITLAGKILVIDIDVSLEDHPSYDVKVTSVKTSLALSSAASNALAERSTSLDDFLKESLCSYVEEVQHGNQTKKSRKAGRLAKNFCAYLTYLMKMDTFAHQEGDAGIRWFNDIGTLCSSMDQLANLEAETVARGIASPKAPLDVFLLRGHALALPYCVSPSMSFLIHISPQSYLSLLGQISTAKQRMQTPFDIPPSSINAGFLRSEPKLSGVAIATLSLCPSNPQSLSKLQFSSYRSRPNFPLCPSSMLVERDHTFPEPDSSTSGGSPDTWILDFTDGGTNSGIIMTQTRMREIQLVVNPDLMGVMDGMSIQGMNYGFGSWVDLLLNPSGPPSDRYVATYKSPSNAHPPLHLRLTPPDEPGFMLGRVRVSSLKEVWGVLEVVRDQCWINETLTVCSWIPEGQSMPSPTEEDNTKASEEELRAILNGTFKPRRIPVNVFIQYQALSEPTSLFSSHGDLDMLSIPSMTVRQGPLRLVMTVQTRENMQHSQLQIAVGNDTTRPRGVRVDVNGSLPFTTAQIEKLEEIARRGGVLGLAGRLWNTHS